MTSRAGEDGTPLPGLGFDPPDDDEPQPHFEDEFGPQGDAEPPGPINWETLSAAEAQVEWLELDSWVNWLRRTYGLGPGFVPPLWHRHPELVWELSALRQHWLSAYDPQQHGSAPLGWHRDFADARMRLHDWVAACGTRLDRDRPTRQTAWPGEDPAPAVDELPIANRDDDFAQFVLQDVRRRSVAQHDVHESR